MRPRAASPEHIGTQRMDRTLSTWVWFDQDLGMKAAMATLGVAAATAQAAETVASTKGALLALTAVLNTAPATAGPTAFVVVMLGEIF